MERHKAEIVVVDAVAFFKNVQLQDFAEKIYTVRPVVGEIKDSKTRQRLAVLPYQLNFREPSTENIQKVSEFARKTGDYQSLSAVDIQVMALTYQMTKELVGTTQLKLEPQAKKTFSASTKPLEKNNDIVGFYYPSQNETHTVNENSDIPLDLTELSISEDVEETEPSVETADKSVPHSESGTELQQADETGSNPEVVADETGSNSEVVADEGDHGDCMTGRLSGEDGETTPQGGLEQIDDNDGQKVESPEQSGSEDDHETGEENTPGENEDDDVGWITPQNLQNAKNKMATDITDSLQGIKVACLTSDFAMQNVLIQMGVPVMSVEGMLIKRAKSYALRCFACFKVTSDTNRAFCPKCGNPTLTKVSVSVDEQGNTHYHMSNRRRYRVGELRQSLPLPKGGKHAYNPIVCEDQPRPEERLARKAMIRNNVFDPDYAAQNSPFVTRDVTSRSAILGVARKKNKRGHRK